MIYSYRKNTGQLSKIENIINKIHCYIHNINEIVINMFAILNDLYS